MLTLTALGKGTAPHQKTVVEDLVTDDEFSQQSAEQEIPTPTEPGDERTQAKEFRNSFIEHVHSVKNKYINKRNRTCLDKSWR